MATDVDGWVYMRFTRAAGKDCADVAVSGSRCCIACTGHMKPGTPTPTEEPS